jgi:hypothetical protein
MHKPSQAYAYDYPAANRPPLIAVITVGNLM